MIKLRPEIDEENTRYVNGGAPPQPFLVMLPPKESLPTIRTERLCLRPVTLDDAQAVWDARSKKSEWLSPYTSSDEMYQWLNRKTFTEPAAAVGLMFQFVIVLGQNPAGKVIGCLGMNTVYPVPNIGYWVGEEYWGMGYMSEALAGLMAMWWTFPRRKRVSDEEERREGWDGKERVFATVNKRNLPSLRVLEKNGFRVYLDKTMADGEVLCCAAAERPELSCDMEQSYTGKKGYSVSAGLLS
ncbi:N-acetyltransferase [Coccidioides immitis RS]|uniref:N-acetyltransferase n=4 Tax=Coccidioides immitis TaxID=5501 RepID=J3KH84_COCIM|nr:N-acetyltransferase [Coccidioides immitis RS]KMP00415.1 hypothetical protein CIRG_00557 [Coccidioides immitis RMSCC 2394]KMU76774.1 hypothetical protein CISG_05607 [Coccidioides immitis RMSCC 3703]KMU84607.1 hypothetical protein CIHG_02391 [Coccidioides immitis H538.4]TPX26519.1 hypothetical protein DIZ76_011981 [Coccidioides immitis]EAS35188.3 N-acetyltransferase [Coccidioides immitis RS]